MFNCITELYKTVMLQLHFDVVLGGVWCKGIEIVCLFDLVSIVLNHLPNGSGSEKRYPGVSTVCAVPLCFLL